MGVIAVKKIVCLIVAAAAFLTFLPVCAIAADPPAIDAKAAIVYEATTDTVLFELNADEKLYPASLTKIMTAVLAIENCDPDEIVTVTSAAINPLVNEGFHAYLIAGEKISFLSLLEYLLIPSGNDAANALAIASSGNIGDFVELMNSKAAAIGCTNTHFTNAHGLHDDDHYSTARDMLLISEYAMQLPLFAETVRKTSMTLPVTNKHSQETLLNTTNALLGKNGAEYIYKGTTGIKTGSTTPAGLCLSASYEKDGLLYYAVILGSKTTEDGKKGNFLAAKSLFNYASQNFSMQTLLKQTTPITEIPVTVSPDGESVILLPKESISALLPNDFKSTDVKFSYDVPDSVEAPISKGEEIGKVSVTYNGHDYGTIPLVSSSSFTRSDLLYKVKLVRAFFKSKGTLILIGLGAIVLIFIIIGITRASRRRRKARRYGSTRNRYR